ncbi:MAG TPA: cupredoxin domain-containing protein [Alphaproteobacteria bacterium]|nr:cupredoxin domain-containing protein [Alphaproteobacteria bacterium]
MLAAACASGASLGADVAPPVPANVDWKQAETVTVRLSDFEYSPAYLRFRIGTPVRIRLINEGSGQHDFSAPAFFNAASYPPGIRGPDDGDIAVKKGQTVEIELVPNAAGKYHLRCTEFLHALFGMTGEIEVTAR